MAIKKVPIAMAKKPIAVGATKSSEYALPEKPKKACSDFFLYASLLYGRPGIGKTSFLSSFPDALLLSCERVSKGIECFDFNAENGGVTSWTVFLAAIDLLEKTPGRFKTVGIDTIDALYSHCLDYTCKKNGMSHPSDEGYGKGWEMVRKNFTAALDRLWATKRGIVFTSHAKEVEVKSHSGETYTRIQPTMSGQAYGFIKAKTDFVFYAEYYRDAEGNPLRILITSGDDVVDAKSAGNLPRFLPFEKGKAVETVLAAFDGEDVGLNPNDLRAGKQTSKSGGNLIVKARNEALLANKKKVVHK
jgi:hypothetical protein